MDLNGVHTPQRDTVNLDSLGLAQGEMASLDVSYAERHTWDSHLRIETTIPLLVPTPAPKSTPPPPTIKPDINNEMKPTEPVTVQQPHKMCIVVVVCILMIDMSVVKRDDTLPQTHLHQVSNSAN